MRSRLNWCSQAKARSTTQRTLPSPEPWATPRRKKTNGRKRHIAVDTLGLPVMITVTPADTTDRDAARELLPAGDAAPDHADLGRLRLCRPAHQLVRRLPRHDTPDRLPSLRGEGLRRPAPPLESRTHPGL
ncbi:hypothetical protein EW053_34220 [Streptomyces sp. IB2014 016-6]|nr:hypothetical protein EW053_34220 [Streptomyces sp. IB2014 016-6]